MRRLLRIFAWTFGSLIGLLLLFAAFIYFYSDTIKASVVSEVNKTLSAQVHVGDIQISAFKNFPQVSVNFEQVSIEESYPVHDSALAVLEEVSLTLDIWDVLRKEYRIKGLKISNGYLSLGTDGKGNDNFSIFKSDSSTNDTASTQLSFEKINLHHLNILYTQSDDRYQFEVSKLACTGNFSDAVFDANLKGDVLTEIVIDKKSIFKPKLVKLNSDLIVDQNDELLKFQETFLGIEDLAFGINGNWSIGKGNHGKIEIETRDAEIKKLLSLLPGDIKNRVEDYGSAGVLRLKASLDKKAGKDIDIRAKFGVDNGSLYLKEFREGLSSIRLDGEMRYNGKQEFIHLKKFEARLMEDLVKGSIRMDGFDDPFLSVFMLGDFNLANLKRIADLGDYNDSKGKVLADISLKGKLSELKDPKKYRSIFLDGKIKGEQLNIGADSLENKLTDVNTFIELKASDCSIHRLEATWNGQRIQIQGQAKNYLAYLFNEEELKILGRLKANSLHFENPKTEQTKTSTDTNGFSLPPRVSMEAEVEIGKLSFEKFEATEITGRAALTANRLDIRRLRFKSCEGEVSLDGNWTKKADGNQPVVIKANLHKVNIQRLFYEMDNFAQAEITDKNLKGSLSGNVDAGFFLDRDFSFQSKSLYAFLDLVIEGGELNQYEPLKALSKYVRVEDLENVRFQKLENQIEIRDEVIYIPSMEIRNSAMNLHVEGRHGFDNVMDYSIKLQLKDVLAGRYMKTHDEDEFEKEEEGVNMFIRMSGSPDKLNIRYDSKKARKNLKQEIKKEQKTVKEILKQEFGFDKKEPEKEESEEEVPDWEDDIPE